jgi:hypothetical protein
MNLYLKIIYIPFNEFALKLYSLKYYILLLDFILLKQYFVFISELN